MTRVLGVQTAKELRQLLPWWAAVATTMVVLGELSARQPRSDVKFFFDSELLFLASYFAGAVALGALAIGHEYSHRTLTSLLAQPIDRKHLLWRKLSILAIVLLALALVARWQVPAMIIEGNGLGTDVALFGLPLLLAVSIAPWSTMVSRGPLAGAIFTLAAPFLLTIVTHNLATAAGMPSLLGMPEIEPPETFMWCILALGIVGVVMTWRSFMRLQAIDGPHAEIDVPALLPRSDRQTGTATRVQTETEQLVRKELRLHQGTFLIAAAYVVIWAGIALGRVFDPKFMDGLLTAAHVMYALLVSLMAGATASAEERKLVTADWQLLLPISSWWPWAIKAGTAFALAAALGIGLPYLLGRIHPFPDHLPEVGRGFSVALMMTCAFALYVSSLSTGGMRAFLTSMPVVAGAWAAFWTIFRSASWMLSAPLLALLRPYRSSLQVHAPVFRELASWSDVEFVVITVGLLLAFSAANHRTVDRSRPRIIRQGCWIAGWLLVFIVSQLLLSTLSYL